MKRLSMTLSSPTVPLVNGKGSLTASVTNGSPTSERVVLGAFPGSAAIQPSAEPAPAGSAASSTAATPRAAGQGTAATWTTIADPLRTIAPGATVQYDVAFDTTGAAPGTYPVKLIPYSADEAPEDYGDLAAVVQLVVTAAPPVVPPKKFPWILVGAAALVVVLGLGAVWFLTRPAKPVAQPSPSQVLNLTSIQPAQGPLSGGTTVALNGTFRDPMVVSVGGVSIPATRISGTQYAFITKPASQAGKVLLEVRSGGGLVGAALFEYLAPSGGGGGHVTCKPTICVKVPAGALQFKRDPGGPVIDPVPGEVFNPRLDGPVIDQLQKLGQ